MDLFFSRGKNKISSPSSSVVPTSDYSTRVEIFFCCVGEQDSCVTTDVAKKEADLRYILKYKFCLRSTTVFLLPLGNLAAALLPEG